MIKAVHCPLLLPANKLLAEHSTICTFLHWLVGFCLTARAIAYCTIMFSVCFLLNWTCSSGKFGSFAVFCWLFSVKYWCGFECFLCWRMIIKLWEIVFTCVLPLFVLWHKVWKNKGDKKCLKPTDRNWFNWNCFKG